MSEITRREFLRRMAVGTAVVGTTVLTGCDSKSDSQTKSTGVLPDIPIDKMTYRTNRNSGDKVSILGYGCMRWPTRPKENGEGDELDQEQINRLVDTAIEHGVNYFDTSPVYCQGESERATGIALSRYDRKDYLIATKLSNFSPDTQTYEGSVQMYRNSLKMLQTDYLDYLLLHAIGGNMEDFNRRFINNGVLDFLVAEKKEGRIRNLGFSFHGSQECFDQLMKLHDDGAYHWDFVQIQMNYLDWKNAFVPSEYLYNELTRRNIPVVIMEPLLGGRLSKVNDHIVGEMKSREPERTVASWAFRFCGTWDNVLTTLSGMTYMEHLEDNLRSFCPLQPLTDDEMDFLDKMATEIMNYPTIPCTGCQYCMPCPYGLDIPGIFAHYNKCINEGQMPTTGEDENYAKLRRAFLIGYDRSVPRLRQADHCVGCRQCVEHCPQKIDIPSQMDRIDEFVEKLKTNEL